jgi:DNA-binding transcriptional MerR regulator
MAYTIKKIADLAGVTTRTLRYYDQIGLLSPAQTGDNGYRYYDQGSLLTLQQIMFFRELDVPLKDIQLILDHPDFDLLQALQDHRRTLQAKARRLETLIDTVDETIATIKGDWIMNDKNYFEGFDESQYEDEVKERWGDTPQYAESQRKWKSYTKEQKDALKQQGGEITIRMVGTAENTPSDPAIQQAVADYYAYLIGNFYQCDVEFLRNLSDMWVEDPRFAVNYDRIREGGAAFVRQAVHIFCDHAKS